MKITVLFTGVLVFVSYTIGWSQTSYGGTIDPATTAGVGGGITNSYFGHEAGLLNTGSNNTFLGHQSGISNTTGYENSALGSSSLRSNTGGTRNIANGTYSLYYNTLGSGNIAIGYAAMGFNTTGNNNTASGYESLLLNVSGTGNTVVGYQSGASNTTGSGNTYLGLHSGYTNQVGSGNVFIGYRSGYNETGSSKLYIDNSDTTAPLVWGDFDNDIVNFNGQVGIGNPSPSTTLDVNGTVKIGNTPTPAGYNLYVENGILTERVRVAVNGSANWADYVFEDNYVLKPLEDVAAFIKKNKHLPGIPSAQEVAKVGLDLAQMDAKLLEKIEELTLYLIETKKAIEALKKENKALRAAIINLKK